MPQLYAFQPDGHGPKSFFVIAESLEDALVRVQAYIKADNLDDYFYRGIDRMYVPRGNSSSASNGVYDLTILNPGEVIDNDNS